ncbi:hypothetical protein ABZ172_04975 [Streptomyces sp. NPDC006296]|uniref:hypothetical protein n=1 Tax=Streptomyces sp. NPDC006296 TaxID=3156746 RepID=UPI0033A6FD6B
MADRPITPTRIIPAGAPLPDRGPLPGELPPWWQQAAPPPPPPPAVVAPPAPAPPPDPQIHVHVVIPYEEPPEPTRWERLWAWLRTIGRPWQVCGALTLAFLPLFGGDSVATLWASCVTEARAEGGPSAAYTLALTPLAIAVIRITTGGGTVLRLLLLAVSIVGLAGAIDLYDPVTWITGVTR